VSRVRGGGDHEVETVRYSPAEEGIWINKTQCFRPVPREVWELHIGGYQVLDKYLKSRKGRTLTLDEITHLAAVADSLAFTIAQMARIDKAYGAAFPDGGNRSRGRGVAPHPRPLPTRGRGAGVASPGISSS
jgi:hypothetical protein